MRSSLVVLSLLIGLLSSCQDNSRKDKSLETTSDKDTLEVKNKVGTSAQDQPVLSQEPKTPEPATNISGRYIKNDHLEDTACNCYCLEIQMNSTSELCLKAGELYIDGRFEKDGDNIHIYYNGKSSRTQNEKIPWEKFEKNTPIAVLSPTPTGFKLDWKGFSMDGKIAVDYALYGKKTLEGEYKKK